MKPTKAALLATLACGTLFVLAGSATAAGPGATPGLDMLAVMNAMFGDVTTGQPNQSCEDNPNPPGNSSTAPGSAFNPTGVAGTVYAGQQPQNLRNPMSVSQYDVACTRPVR